MASSSSGLGKNPAAIRSPLIGKPRPRSRCAKSARPHRRPDAISRQAGRPQLLGDVVRAVLGRASGAGRQRAHAPGRAVPRRRLSGRRDKILSFLNQRGSSYPTVVDDAGKTAIAYGVGGVPETLFLDANGVIQAKFTGPMSTDALQAHLRKVFSDDHHAVAAACSSRSRMPRSSSARRKALRSTGEATVPTRQRGRRPAALPGVSGDVRSRLAGRNGRQHEGTRCTSCWRAGTPRTRSSSTSSCRMESSSCCVPNSTA